MVSIVSYFMFRRNLNNEQTYYRNISLQGILYLVQICIVLEAVIRLLLMMTSLLVLIFSNMQQNHNAIDNLSEFIV